MGIVGREAELAVVRRFLDEVASGTRALFLAGEAGIGKSTIWQAALAEAGDRGYRVVSSRPTEAEARLPFAGLNDLFGDLLDDARPELPEPQQKALDVALLRATHAGPPPEPLAISLAVLGLLRVAVRSGPLVVAIDDVPWFDESSAGILEFALRRLDTEPIGLIAAQRTTGQGAALPAVAALLQDRQVVWLDVAPLALGDIDRLLAATLDLGLTPSTLGRLHRMSGGNPFYAVEIARALQRRGLTSVHGDLPLPDTLIGLVRDRLDALSAAAAAVTIHAATLSQPTRPILEAALGPDVTASGLAEAEGANVLTVDGDQLRFTHPLLAAEAYAGQAETSRRDVHRRLAGMVSEPEEHARHLALAADGPDADVAAALEHAAEHAHDRGAPDAAADLAERAASLTPSEDAEADQRRTAAAARYRLLAGDIGRSRQLLEDALARVPDGSPRAEILMRLGEVRQQMDDWVAAELLFEEALRHARKNVRQQILIKLGLAGVGFITLRNWSSAARHAADAMRLAEELGDQELLARTIGPFTTWEFIAGHGLRRDLMQRAAELEPWTGRLRTMDQPDFDFGLLLADEGDRPGFRERFERLLMRAEQRGDYSSLSFLLTNLAEADFLDGKAGLARDRLDRAERLARTTGQKTALAHVLSMRTSLLARLGDASDAWRIGEEALEIITATGWREGEAYVLSDLGLLELSRRNAARAHELFDLARTASGPRAQFMRIIPVDVEALVGLGRLEEARALLDEFEHRARSFQRVPAIADSLRARGLLRGAEGDLEEASRLLAEADALYERLDDTWNRARNLLIMGEVHRRARRRAKAREAFTAAAERFEQLGARIWAERARAELSRNAARRVHGQGLTPTQLHVAELVSSGRTNREVADDLFMSVHTVEAHLSSIYRSLGIRSRSELGRVLRDRAATIRDSASPIQDATGLPGSET